MRWLWPFLASMAGAITALSFRPFKRMSPVDIAMALFVGTTFAWFVSPWANSIIFGKEPPDIRVLGAVFYLMASGSNILIPLAIKWLRKLFGSQLTEGEP
jgi:hypothetical protein